MNKILFGIIGALMLVIAGMGAFSLYHSSKTEGLATDANVSAVQGSQANQVASAPVSSGRSDDEDEDEDEGGNAGSMATQPTQTSGGGTSGSVGATSPTPTPGTYTMAQVKQHNTASSCYTAINGSVYDVTSWIKQHPGGAQAIISLCGIDGSAAFSAQHGGQSRPASELAAFKIGTLAK